MTIADILEALETFHAPDVFNPWRDFDPLDRSPACAAGDRRLRLGRHLSVERARFLLIGEAPGYQGCHFSGVPFTNEALVVGGTVPRMGKWDRFTTRPRPWSEPSASIVWGALHALGIAEETLMWNAFAFHPHKPGEPYTNRAPRREELTRNAAILRRVVEYARDLGATPVAVGNVAHAALERLGVRNAAKLRHPSMGGANAFREGLRALAGGQ